MRTESIRRVLADGGPGFCQIAVTNACNAACGFCSFAGLPRSQWVVPETAEVARAIDALGGRGVGYVVFVGGEPLMHPGIFDLIAHTRSRGMAALICTNGSLLKEETIKRLHRAGLNGVIISIDAPSEEAHEANRGFSGLCGRIREANRLLRHLGYNPTASVTLSRLVQDLESLPPFLRGLGFGKATFSYPLNYLGSSYLSFSSSALIDFSRAELIDVFQSLIRLKRSFPVLNPRASLEDMVRFLRGEKGRFPCLAGYKYFFIDWHLDLYRCHYVKKPMCKARDFGEAEFIRDDCTACMIDCYRDPSVLQFGAVALADSLRFLRQGRLGAAARRLFDSRTLESFRSVFEERKWISEM
ncbi:MAG: radical SAM protein [Pseudomonadota bacterium]